MDPGAAITVGLAIVNMLQVVLLAWINKRAGHIEHSVNGHLDSLTSTQATERELARRPPPPAAT